MNNLFITIDDAHIIKAYSGNMQDVFPDHGLVEEKLGNHFDFLLEEDYAELAPKYGKLQGEIFKGRPFRNGAHTVLQLSSTALKFCPRKLNKELRDSIEAHNKFLITTTHELKSPISVLLASTEYLELLLKDVEEQGPDVKKCLSSIKDSCFYLSTIGDDLMDVASFVNKKISLKYQEVDIVGIVKQDRIGHSVHLKRPWL